MSNNLLKEILIILLLSLSTIVSGQMQKIVFPKDTFSNSFYVNIYGDNAFISMAHFNKESDFGKLYFKNGKKWQYFQKINRISRSGSGSGFRLGILSQDFLYVTKVINKNSQNREVMIVYEKKNNYFYAIDTILPDTVSHIAGFDVGDNYLFFRDYWEDFSDFPNIRLINSYYFYKRENGKWVKKSKISYESDISGTYVSLRFAMINDYAYAGQGKKLIIFKRNGDYWEKHQEIYNENQPEVEIRLISNISVSDNGKWLAFSTFGQILIFKLHDGKYEFYYKIPQIDDYRFYISLNIINNQLLVGCRGDTDKHGFVLLYELRNGIWIKKNKIKPPLNDVLYYDFGYTIDRYGETAIASAPDQTSYPIVKNAAAYIFQIPARDTLRAWICEGESYVFNDTIISTSGHYVDTLLASYGVDSVVQLYLTVYPKEQVVIDTILCEDEILIVGDSILDEVGDYEINLKNIYGCDSIITVILDYEQVEVADSIIADYGCQNGEINLSLQGNNTPYAFHWDTGQSEEEIIGLSAGEYQVTITDKSGCKHEYEYTVGDSIPYLIPTAFIPSGQEEINSTFRIYLAKNVHVLSTEIYDRWGEKVFTGAQDEFWDGTYQGKAQSPGVYLYKVVIDSPCGKDEKRGQVLLLR